MRLAVLFFLGLCFSCNNTNTTPKPKAFLRLDYPYAVYKKTRVFLPFTFEKNELADSLSQFKKDPMYNTSGIAICYPLLDGALYLTYKPISSSNLERHIKDAEKITNAHNIKADAIIPKAFEDQENNVYGMFYTVEGNVASLFQFYLTDGNKHFLNGALYFNTRPNYDSIYPAAMYVRKDLIHMIETLRWD